MLDRVAETRGLAAGMSLADARGAVPDLLVEEWDEAADAALLEAVADWCDRYTPLVALDPPHGLFLDISGCTHLFTSGGAEDGEAALLADCLDRLRRQGFEAHAAIASTPGTAWAVARTGAAIVPARGERAALAGLPVAALRIAPETERLLDRLGLKRIGQLIGQPRAPLAARFGMDLVRRLDQALGAEEEALSPRRPAPAISAERRFAEPISEEAAVRETVRSLARSLQPALERRGAGARLVELSLFRTDGHVARAALRTAAPVREPDTVTMLIGERLTALGDTIDAGFGIDMMRLAVLEIEALDETQIDMAGEGHASPDLQRLVDRLGARLGHGRVTRIVPVDTHIPERAARIRPLAALGGAVPAWRMPDAEEEDVPDRPLRLFRRPEPIDVTAEVPEGPPRFFRWRRVTYAVARAEGPERIAPEWWQAEDDGRGTRDYYRVEDAEGRRYWLFREGLYGHATDHPAWYVHGLFA